MNFSNLFESSDLFCLYRNIPICSLSSNERKIIWQGRMCKLGRITDVDRFNKNTMNEVSIVEFSEGVTTVVEVRRRHLNEVYSRFMSTGRMFVLFYVLRYTQPYRVEEINGRLVYMYECWDDDVIRAFKQGLNNMTKNIVDRTSISDGYVNYSVTMFEDIVSVCRLISAYTDKYGGVSKSWLMYLVCRSIDEPFLKPFESYDRRYCYVCEGEGIGLLKEEDIGEALAANLYREKDFKWYTSDCTVPIWLESHSFTMGMKAVTRINGILVGKFHHAANSNEHCHMRLIDLVSPLKQYISANSVRLTIVYKGVMFTNTEVDIADSIFCNLIDCLFFLLNRLSHDENNDLPRLDRLLNPGELALIVFYNIPRYRIIYNEICKVYTNPQKYSQELFDKQQLFGIDRYKNIANERSDYLYVLTFSLNDYIDQEPDDQSKTVHRVMSKISCACPMCVSWKHSGIKDDLLEMCASYIGFNKVILSNLDKVIADHNVNDSVWKKSNSIVSKVNI
jgi:hypothetical protein